MTRCCLFLLALVACREAEEPALTVLAASSLTESLQQAGAAWTAAGNGAVTFTNVSITV